MSSTIIARFKEFYQQKDYLWALIWGAGILMIWGWDLLYLNEPARRQIEEGFFNTFIIAFMVIVFSALLSWGVTLALYFLEDKIKNIPYSGLNFILNLIRSVPQIIGILLGYLLITYLMATGSLSDTFSTIILTAFVISLFVFLELVDLMRERIAYFKKSDFFNAMRVCGIPEPRIINRDILWKNSWVHLFNKMISIFGITVFLLCSIDFIVSVGLTTDVSTVNFPVTLGSLLAKIDSKQDILAIGNTIGNIGYISNIFFKHLQGITIAFVIVFSLLSIYKISNGFARRYHL
ncbi:MAG: hypothetical protein AB7W47_17920 [Calditrichaceae bacterium]